MNTTRKIARFVVELSLDEVPLRALEIAKGGIIDSLGAAIAGTRSDAAQIVTRWTREQGGTPSCGVIGGAFKTSPASAARANGTIGHAFDYDPPLPLLPVLLALGESERASGREMLEAYVTGFEVQSKLQGGVSEKHTAHGWHSNTVFGTFGATAAAAKLLKLDDLRTGMAFGIAASATGGILQNLGTMTKPLHAGMAAANGIMAASLAREGFGSAPDGLEGEYGVLRVFATSGEYDEHKISATFGAPWDLVAKEIRIKPFPCCRWAHRPLDALLELVRTHDLRPEDIESIECEVGAHVSKVMAYPVARSALEAKFCMPYCLAVAVCDRSAGLEQFTEERVRDAQVQAFASRVRVVQPGVGVISDTGPLAPCRVRIRMKNAKVLEKMPREARGDRENPMSFEEIVGKYRDCTRGLLAPEDSEHLLALVRNIETAQNLSSLYSILTCRVQAQPASVS